MLPFRAKRFWLPRDAEVKLTSDGFPLDPDSDFAPFLTTRPLSFESFAQYPALGLIGEPGMGKTTTMNVIAEELHRSGELVFSEDLALCGGEISLREAIRNAKALLPTGSDQKLNVFFDGLDDSLRTSANFVGVCLRLLRELPSDRILVRFACRSAEWPSDFEAGLREIWGKSSVAVYQLMPLLRKDVQEAAESTGIDGTEFLKSVDAVGASAFACRPITLEFLLGSFKNGRGLSFSKPDLYLNGCLTLADESRSALRRLPRLASAQRFAIASRIAATSVFCRRPVIWTGLRNTAPEHDLQIEDVGGGLEKFKGQVAAVDLDTIRETLDTGLFCSKGPDRVGFAHQTYAEYLAAKFLVSRNLPSAEILKFVEHPDGPHKIIPQLRDVAAWLAGMDAGVCHAIIANDPEIMFLSQTPPVNKLEREMLVREILRLFESGELDDEHVVSRTRINLKDLKLAADLKRYLVDHSYTIAVRRVAVLVAERGHQTVLQTELIKIAFDDTEVDEIRALAVAAVGVIGSERNISSLRTLLSSDEINDPDDEIKGAILTATWPRHITATELFGALSPPKRKNFSGRYQRFLVTDIVSNLKREDMAIALTWADHREGHIYPEVNPLDSVAVAVLNAAIGFYAEPGFSERLAGILGKRTRWGRIDSSVWVTLYENDCARRVIGLAAIKKEADQQSTYSASLDLLRTNDIGFLMAELERSTQSEFKDRLCATIGQLLRRTEPASVEALQQVVSLMRTDSTFATFVAPALAPIQLDSPEAQMLRGYTERVKLQTKTRQVVSSPVPEIDDLLESRTAGSKEIFFDICFRLSQPQANWKTDDGVVPPGWLQLTTVAQVQIIDAADTYLRECRAPEPAWIPNNELPFAVMFGHWAFRLLLQEAKSRFDSLPDRAWQEWILSAFGHPFRAIVPDPQEAMILKTARCKAPREFIQAVSLFIEEQDRSIGTTHIIDRLSCTWDIGIAECLRAKLSEHPTNDADVRFDSQTTH